MTYKPSKLGQHVRSIRNSSVDLCVTITSSYERLLWFVSSMNTHARTHTQAD